MKTQSTKELEKDIIDSTLKMGVYGVLECSIGQFGNTHEIVDYITYDTKGIFRCYEIKVSLSDFNSKNKKTFIGHYNYYVLTPDLYEKVKDKIPEHIGVYVGGKNVKKAKKQELIKPDYLEKDPRDIEHILKDSIIRSLSRDYNKSLNSSDIEFLQNKDRQIRHLNNIYNEERRKYIELTLKLFKLYGRCYENIIDEKLQQKNKN